MKTLRTLFLDELADIHDAEKRLKRALPKFAKVATSPELQAAIHSHLAETEGHIEKLAQVFADFGEKPVSKKCVATVGLLDEGEEIAAEFAGSPAINAALICAMQKVEHYEMATYGCLRDWAVMLGQPEAGEILQGILDEEGAADRHLTTLARGESNTEALDEDDTVETATHPSTNGKTAKPKRKGPLVAG